MKTMKSILNDMLNDNAPKKAKKPAPPVKLNMDVEIPKDRLDDFVELVFRYGDFEEYISWYGFRLVARHKERGLLITDDETSEPEDDKKALFAWRQEQKPRIGYFHITKGTAIQIYLEGVKWGGICWEGHPDCDGNTYCECLQRVLFGKVKY
jgi:hypothetical protein